MDQAEGLVPERRVRRWRSVAEKRQIVELTLEPGASVALVARAHGVNANQVFKWRRAFERGELVESVSASDVLCFRSRCLLLTSDEEPEPAEPSVWCYPYRVSRRAMISVESGADAALVAFDP